MLKEKKHLLEQVEREYLLYHAHAPFVFPSLSFCHGLLCPASGCSISPCHLMAMGLFDCAPVDAGPTGYPARKRGDLVRLGFLPCSLSSSIIL